jgi:hypothetical protein
MTLPGPAIEYEEGDEGGDGYPPETPIEEDPADLIPDE